MANETKPSIKCITPNIYKIGKQTVDLKGVIKISNILHAQTFTGPKYCFEIIYFYGHGGSQAIKGLDYKKLASIRSFLIETGQKLLKASNSESLLSCW